MSSLAESDLNAGFDLLIETSAETLTFRGQPLIALVNRNPGEETSDKRTPDFSERERSVIAIPRTAVNPLPRSGETATDSFGHAHRVEKVEPRGDVYYLHCKVVAPPAA